MPAIERLAVEEALEIEHIQLGSEDETMPLGSQHGTVGAVFTSASRLHGRSSRLEIVDGRCLRVAVRRRASHRTYLLDLRFVDPDPVHRVRIARGWLNATLACALLALIVHATATSLQAFTGSTRVTSIGHALLAGAAFAAALTVWRSRAFLTFTSRRGRAPLVALEGVWYRGRRVTEFVNVLRSQINACIACASQSSAHSLRDEMREHFRLHEAGVLGRTEYEASRARILRAHG